MYEEPESSRHVQHLLHARRIALSTHANDLGLPWNFTTRSLHPLRSHSPRKYISCAAQVVYVGVDKTTSKPIPMVARVAVTDYRGNILINTYVHPTHPISDYRSAETGLQYEHLVNAPPFQDVQRRVFEIMSNKILVGHSLWKLLSVLGLCHPAIDTRDLALFLPLRRRLQCKSIVSLPVLMHRFMGRNIGFNYEDPLEMARAGIDLFRSCEDVFEEVIRSGAWPCDLPPTQYAQCYT